MLVLIDGFPYNLPDSYESEPTAFWWFIWRFIGITTAICGLFLCWLIFTTVQDG